MADRPIFDLGPVRDSDLDIGIDAGSGPGADQGRDLQQVRSRARTERDRRSGLGLAAVAITVAVSAFVLVPRLLSDDGSSQRAEPPPEQVFEPEGAAGAGSAGHGSDETAGGFEPPSAPHLRADQVALLFDTALDDAATSYGIAYVANEDFVVLDRSGISVREPEIAVDFATVANLALLTNNGRTWAIDPVDRDRRFLVSNSYVVVVSQRPGTIAVIRPEDTSEIGLMSSALPAPAVELPEGAELLWVQRRGPLVMPRTGGTFEVAGLASSLERISDDRAVAASAGATIYETCDDDLACSFVARVGSDSDTVPLPFDPDTMFWPSPDGSLVIAQDDLDTVLYDVERAARLATLPGGATAIDWAPDSSFVAVAAADQLHVVQTGSAEVVSLELNHTPDKNSLLVFASSR